MKGDVRFYETTRKSKLASKANNAHISSYIQVNVICRIARVVSVDHSHHCYLFACQLGFHRLYLEERDRTENENGIDFPH